MSRQAEPAVAADEPPAPVEGARLLEVRNLKTSFRLPQGRLRAVDDVSLSLERGRTLGVVGESGSGKTVLSRSIMGLLIAGNVERSGTVLLEGRDLSTLRSSQLRKIWGREMAMVFQDPMTSLNPVMRIGRQVSESMVRHLGYSRGDANTRAANDILSSWPGRRFAPL